MLQSMNSLESLHVVILCRYFDTRKLIDHEGLESIRGLKDFELRVQDGFYQQEVNVRNISERIKGIVT